jgi:type IV secretion system protein VirB6
MFDFLGAILSAIVLMAAIIFSAIAIAAIIAAKIMLFITLALAPIWIVLWLYRWSSRISEGFISLTTYLIIQQILIYGFLGFYFSLVNLALNTALSGGASADSKMSMVLPLVLVTIIGIYIFTQLPAITAILNGGGYIDATKTHGSYQNAVGRSWRGGRRAVRGIAAAAGGASRTYRRMRSGQAASREAAKVSIQRGARENGAPLV